MPFYEYVCQACGAHHEAMQKMSDAPLKKCPECGRQRLKRLISAPVFRLKGGGWYETDFKSDKESKRNLHGEDKAPAADAAPKDGTGDAAAKTPAATPEAKAEAKPVAKPAARRPAAKKAKPAAKARRKR